MFMLPGTEEHLPQDVNSREHKRLTEETSAGMRDVVFWVGVSSVGMIMLMVIIAGLKHFLK